MLQREELDLTTGAITDAFLRDLVAPVVATAGDFIGLGVIFNEE